MIITIEAEVPDQDIQHYEQAGIDWKAQARKLIEDGLPSAVSPLVQDSDAKRKAAIAWLRERVREAEQMTDEEKAEAELEVEELKRNLNATRAENGERLLFP